MKAVLVLMDSLNRHFLPPYGNDWVMAPNIRRLAERSVTFDRHFIGSAPCMPARRDMLTGRLNFLERGWGGIEPFDRCFTEDLSRAGVFTHMVTDHYHYVQVGGENYHCTFDTWDLYRGQESDKWVSTVVPPDEPPHLGRWRAQYARNRSAFRREEDYPSQQTFAGAIDWVRANAAADNWFLMIEAFDPHEPFDVPQEYLDLYGDDWEGPEYMWPNYAPTDDSPEALRHIRRRYAACLTMLDRWFGLFLDELERQGIMDETLIILTTDHGHMLGEHGLMAKNYQHAYNELAHIPLFVHLPGNAHAGERRSQLSQNLDLAPTLMEYFGVPWEHPIHGVSLWPALNDAAAPTRDYALYGWHGSAVNVTDGHHTYFRAPANEDNGPLYQYGCMAANYDHYWPRERFHEIDAGRFLSYTDMPVFRLPERRPRSEFVRDTRLYDIKADPGQERDLTGSEIEARYVDLLARAMAECDAPAEQYTRLGLKSDH
jgi:arylsulfatase A-like enzyme